MPTNRDLLKEAIADAKAVKETAISNAKAALEETFTPHLKSMLSAKLEEMDKDEEVEIEEMDAASFDEKNGESTDSAPKKVGQTTLKEEDEIEESIELEELLAELEEGEEKTEVNESDDIDETDNINETEEEETEDEESEESEDEENMEEDEEIDLEDMTEDDLKSFIEDVINDMVENGELEGAEETEPEEEEITDEENEEEIDIESEEETEDIMEEEEEEFSEIEELKKELQEVNLLNAKLLYVNKIFKAKNLTETKKVKVLKAFDKVSTVKEAKLVFETLNEGITSRKTNVKRINEIKGSASKAMGSMNINAKKPIVESNDMVLRFQKLAGIIKD